MVVLFRRKGKLLVFVRKFSPAIPWAVISSLMKLKISKIANFLSLKYVQILFTDKNFPEITYPPLARLIKFVKFFFLFVFNLTLTTEDYISLISDTSHTTTKFWQVAIFTTWSLKVEGLPKSQVYFASWIFQPTRAIVVRGLLNLHTIWSCLPYSRCPSSLSSGDAAIEPTYRWGHIA